MIAKTSRYFQSERLTLEGPHGPIPYLARRILPQPETIDALATIAVPAATRLDLLAARLQGDPERFWRIADANAAMNPLALTATPGRPLRIPKPGF